MTDWASSGRYDEFECWLADPFTLADIRKVEMEQGSASLNFGYYTDNFVQGSVTLVDDEDYRIDGKDKLIRLKQTTHIGDETFSRTLCTCFVKDSTTSREAGKNTRNLDLIGVMYRYTNDELIKDFQCIAGRSRTKEIRMLVEDGGGILYVEPEATDKIGTVTCAPFELGTHPSQAMNEIAGWIGCEIGVTPRGEIRLAKYLLPSEKGCVYTFEEGANCVRVPGIEHSDNRSDRCNRALFYFSREESSTTDDGYPLTDSATATLSANSTFSYELTGRWATHVEKVNDPCSHAELQAQADRYLEENSGGIEYIEIQAADVYDIECGRCVNFVEDGTTYKCLVTQMEVSSLTPGMLTRYKLKVVD